MHEAPIRPAAMNDQQRRLFVQKAQADRLAFEAAQLLFNGETGKANSVAGQCMTIAGREQMEVWLRHYATTKFKIMSCAVDDFLVDVAAPNVAL